MRKVLLSFILCIVALYSSGQCKYATYIIDPDGYVNVRSSADAKSDVVAKLNSGTVVYAAHSNDDSKWSRISMTKGGETMGFIHTSRLALYDWPLKAYITAPSGEYADICNAPNGKIMLQIPTNHVFLINLIDFQNGWWKIDELVVINNKEEEVSYKIPSDEEYWIHTSNINSDIKGDGTLSFSLLSEPKEGSSIIKDYPAGTLPSIHNILELSPNKLYLKIKLDDGNVGWVPSNIVCYSYFSVCS